MVDPAHRSDRRVDRAVPGQGTRGSAPRGRPPTSSRLSRYVYVALGSNLGDRRATLDSAVRSLQETEGVTVLRRSRWWESVPVGGPPGQENYLNGVVELDCVLPPIELLHALQRIESEHGRTREVPEGPRTLDLDLLLFGALRISTPELTIPHPRMWGRAFVLEPLRELCGAANVARWQASLTLATAR